MDKIINLSKSKIMHPLLAKTEEVNIMKKISVLMLFIFICMTVVAEASFVKAYDIDETRGMYLDVDTLKHEFGRRREFPFSGYEGHYFSGMFYILDKNTGKKIKGAFPMSAIYYKKNGTMSYNHPAYKEFAVNVEYNVFYKSGTEQFLEGLFGVKKSNSGAKEEIHNFYNNMTADIVNDNGYLIIAECMFYTYANKPSAFINYTYDNGTPLIPASQYAIFKEKHF